MKESSEAKTPSSTDAPSSNSCSTKTGIMLFREHVNHKKSKTPSNRANFQLLNASLRKHLMNHCPSRKNWESASNLILTKNRSEVCHWAKSVRLSALKASSCCNWQTSMATSAAATSKIKASRVTDRLVCKPRTCSSSSRTRQTYSPNRLVASTYS